MTPLTLLGTPKTISKIADSGKEITSYFCGDCGTTCFRKGPSFPGLVIIKSGVLDDASFLSDNVPTGELYAPERMAWLPALEGANQAKTMS